MKTQMEIRLECLRLATSLGASKQIAPHNVVGTAMEFYRWVDGHDGDKATPESVQRLASRFSR